MAENKSLSLCVNDFDANYRLRISGGFNVGRQFMESDFGVS